MRKKLWLTSISAFAVTVGVMSFNPLISSAQPLPDGIFVGEQSLGGMTVEEAESYTGEYVNGLAKQKITLIVDGSEVETTAENLGFHWSNPEIVNETTQEYQSANLIKAYFNQKDLAQQPIMIELKTSIDQAAVESFVETECAGLITAPQNATISRENGQFIITPSVAGKEVDIEATQQALDKELEQGLAEPVIAEAIIKESEAAITSDMLESIQDELGTFSTGFSSSGASRSGNLEAGAAKINGRVLLPGETLSGYECMAPFTKANGYFTAGAYENGMLVDSIGGGVCQISTTLYNTALRAEMEIVQRQNHSMTIGYVKHSMDAAIAGTYKDLKFTNSYDTPVYVEGYTSGRTLTFTIYGKETRPANRTIEFVSETLNVWDPGAATEQLDHSLAPGAKKQVQSSHSGVKSRLWKYVYIDGVEKERTILHTDTYNAAKAVVKIGPQAVVAPVELPPVVDLEPIEHPTVPEPTEAAPVEGVQGGPGVTAPPPTTPETVAPSPIPEPVAPVEPGAE